MEVSRSRRAIQSLLFGETAPKKRAARTDRVHPTYYPSALIALGSLSFNADLGHCRAAQPGPVRPCYKRPAQPTPLPPARLIS